MSNVTPSLLNHLDRNLLHIPNHPLNLLSVKIKEYFSVPRPLFITSESIRSRFLSTSFDPSSESSSETVTFSIHDSISPVASVYDNFDSLGIPPNHPARSLTDTYYLNESTVLRTHMTTHEHAYLDLTPFSVPTAILLMGDVYRRDQIDSVHYPVFHQLEAIRRFGEEEYKCLESFATEMSSVEISKIFSKINLAPGSVSIPMALVTLDLHLELEGLVSYLLGPSNIKMRWVPTEFPFTAPSFELEICKDSSDEYVEILGSGLLTHHILRSTTKLPLAWAAGLGLERLAMFLYGIPDIRLFWSRDERFLNQFKQSSPSIKFFPFSKHPPISRDISFWLPSDPKKYHQNSVSEIIRDISGSLIEQVSLIDEYISSKTCVTTSHCYRIVFRSFERPLCDEEVNGLMSKIKQELSKKLSVAIR